MSFACLPMEYKRLDQPELLTFGTRYWGYDFIIINMGTHPTAYVRIPKNHPFFGLHYDEVNKNIVCPDCGKIHESEVFTFSDSSTNFAHRVKDGELIPEGWWLGWDYAHLGDWQGYLTDEENIEKDNRKYSTEEIVRDCIDVIRFLRKAKYEIQV